MKVLGKQVYRFNGIELDPAGGSVTRDGEELPLRQKSIRALLLLLQERHRLVTKEELIERVWEGLAVTDDALVQLIKEIRHSLGDDPRQPLFIKTIPKGGYRFIAPVEELLIDFPPPFEIERRASVEIEYEEETRLEHSSQRDTDAPMAQVSSVAKRNFVLVGALATFTFVALGVGAYFVARAPRSSELAEVTLPAAPGRKPIVVMPFENQSGDRDLDWLREGLPDMLITDLSRSRHFTMLGRQQLHLLLERNGLAESQEIRLDEALGLSRKVRAEVVALGSFGRLDQKIRVEVQLYDTRNSQLLASERLVVEEPGQLLSQIGVLSLKLSTSLSAPAEEEVSAGLAGVMTNNLKAYRYYSLGVEKAQALRYAEAVPLLEKAVEMDPEFAMAYARIGYTYALCWVRVDEGKPYLEKAYKLSDRLTEKDRLSITAWYLVANQDYPAAIESYRQIISRYPLEVEAYWRLARLLRGEERMQEALDIARKGLLIDSDAKDLYNALGYIYSELGRHDEAIAMFQRYVELAPQEPNAHESLGMGYQWAGRYGEAIQAYQHALALNPDFEIAIVHLGNTYFWQGRYREAIREYERYVAVASYDMTRARGYDSIALAYFKTKNLPQAERAVRESLKFGDMGAGILFLLALERADVAVAEKHLAQIEGQPFIDRGARGFERPRSYLRGYLALKTGRTAQAIEHFKEALRQRPVVFYLDAYEDCLGNAYLELGRFDEAITEYERILRINPNYPLVHYHLAQAYERKGQPDQARQEYARFLEKWKDADIDIPEVKDARARLL